MKSTLLALALVLFGFACSAQSVSFWSNAVTPTNPGNCPDVSTELGLRFQSSVAGQVIGVRFYKSTQNTGTHVGHLWTGTGTLLASVSFSSETASGWQQADFNSPVTIAATSPYVISYSAQGGFYSQDQNFFSVSAFTSGPLTAPESSVNSGGGSSGFGNGVYSRPGGTFPGKNSTYNSNAYVDVVFLPANTPTFTLYWSAVSGATSYNVYRGTVSGGPYSLLRSVSSSPVVDSNTVTGTIYYYVVKSVNSSGTESAASPELSATGP